MKSHCMSWNELHYCLNMQVVISYRNHVIMHSKSSLWISNLLCEIDQRELEYIFSTPVFHFNDGLLLNFGVPCVVAQSQKNALVNISVSCFCVQ